MSDWYVNNVNTHRCFIMSMMYVRNLVDLQLKYYTDYHEVDEDIDTILKQSGRWNDGIWAGLMFRDQIDSPANTLDYVASSNMKN